MREVSNREMSCYFRNWGFVCEFSKNWKAIFQPNPALNLRVGAPQAQALILPANCSAESALISVIASSIRAAILPTKPVRISS
jgi:hypothetical protein